MAGTRFLLTEESRAHPAYRRRAPELGPKWVRRVSEVSRVLGRAAPLGALGAAASLQRPGLPFFTPALPLKGMTDAVVDRTALHAGETVARLDDVVSAAEAVRRLAP